MLDRSTIRGVLTAGLLCIAVGCNGDDPAGPGNTELFRWSFGSDLEGWQTGADDAGGWGDVTVVNADRQDDPPDEEKGSVKLDGTGDPGEPNAWIHRGIALPAHARTLAYWAAGHNRNGGDAALRVRLVDGGGTSHTLADWEEFTGSEGVHHWESRSVSIAAYAGQTVTLYFEQDDNGPGSHEQIYLDDIRILRN
jgi:hypothetical protein